MHDVVREYEIGGERVRALNRVSLTIQHGEYVAIMGPSGSGKSTTMNMVGCLDVPTSGTYRLDGIDVASLSDNELAALRNLKIGFVFQQFNLLSRTTALQNVELPMMYAGVSRKERRARAEEALARVGLSNRLQNRPNELSGGQQQRVSIARALVNRPALLLADEPTGALDSHTTEEILELFEDLHRQGHTIVIVTHEAEVGRRAKRIIRFVDGQVAADSQTDSRPDSRADSRADSRTDSESDSGPAFSARFATTPATPLPPPVREGF
ncbi:MAG: ABC transporter ATP-binding protein [Firmicutes bacterium]|nr:ABC transporter ATP-binding protein [Bacillota bacterium]